MFKREYTRERVVVYQEKLTYMFFPSSYIDLQKTITGEDLTDYFKEEDISSHFPELGTMVYSVINW
jgi:hypothetical protein